MKCETSIDADAGFTVPDAVLMGLARYEANLVVSRARIILDATML